MSKEIFIKAFIVGWGDLDSNSHMKNTAYLDYAATSRFSYFAAKGFSASKFKELQIGPVVFKDEIQFFKELFLLDEFSFNFKLAAMSADGSRFCLVNECFNSQNVKSVSIRTEGAWMNLKERKIISPPSELMTVMSELIKTDDYMEIIRKSA